MDQFRPLNPSVCRSGDTLGKVRRVKRLDPNADHVEVRRGDASLPGDPGAFTPLVGIDTVSDVHSSIVTLGYPLSTPGNLTWGDSLSQTPPMPKDRRWMQQEHFRDIALKYMNANGLSEEVFAEILGYSGGTLHQYMYNTEKRPDAFDFLVPFCRETGRSITEFIDDPSAEGLTETDRFMSRVMGSDLAKLTDTQKQAAVEAWRAIVRGYDSK